MHRVVAVALLGLLAGGCSQKMKCALGGVCGNTSTKQSSSAGSEPGCTSYEPLCISSDPVCTVDQNGCRVCTCQARQGSFAPNATEPGTLVR